MTMSDRLCRHRPAVAVVLVTVASCSAVEEPAFYLLESPGAAPAASLSEPVIGLREVELPLYVRRPQIATIDADGAVTVSDLHRWADDPPRAITRTIAGALADASGTIVVVEPWSSNDRPSVTIDVTFDLLIGALGGTVRAEGLYSVGELGQRTSPTIRRFALTETAPDASYRALVAAHRDLLVRLGAQIAEQVSTSIETE